MTAPHYAHGCDECRHVGSYDAPSGPRDVYVCLPTTSPDERFGALVVRYGDAPEQYSSIIDMGDTFLATWAGGVPWSLVQRSGVLR